MLGRQKKQIAGAQHGDIVLVFFQIMEIQLAFELVKNFIAGIDVIVFALVRPARDKCDEIGVLPDDPSLAPIAAILIDPFLETEAFQMWQHKTSIGWKHYRIASGGESRLKLAMVSARKRMKLKSGRIGLISDTHGLIRPEALAALKGSELIIHAGDIGNPEVLTALKEIAPIIAIRGNNDRDSLGKRDSGFFGVEDQRDQDLCDPQCQ